MDRHGVVQVADALGHVGEIHQGPVRQAQGQVQVSQADVAVQAEDLPSAHGQGRAHACHKGGLAGSALAGYHGDALS